MMTVCGVASPRSQQLQALVPHPSPFGRRWRAAPDEGLCAGVMFGIEYAARPSSALSGTFPQRGKGENLDDAGALYRAKYLRLTQSEAPH